MRRSEQQTAALAVAIQAQVPVLLWGPPGIGKTATVSSVARQLGYETETVILSIREPTDLLGLPVRQSEGVTYAPPAFVNRIVEHAVDGRPSVLFLDEFSTAPPPVQAGGLRIIQERVVGDVRLPPSTSIVAAANPPDLATDGFDLAPPMANRFIHLEWNLDVGAWTTGIVSGFVAPLVPVLPDGWAGGEAKWRGLAAGFVSNRPEQLLSLPKHIEAGSKAWPSPRSWEMAARVAAAADSVDPGGDTLVDLIVGCLGEGPATEFLVWSEAADLPDPESLLLDPSILDLPMRGDRLHAAVSGVVAAVTSNPSADRWESAWEILDRVRAEGQADFAAVAAAPLVTFRDAHNPNWTMPASVDGFLPILIRAGLLPEARGT